MLGTSMSRYLNCDQVIEGHVSDSRQKVKSFIIQKHSKCVAMGL
jgi:hypothetical protein